MACTQTVVLDHPLKDGGQSDADASTAADVVDTGNDVGLGGDAPDDHGLHCLGGATAMNLSVSPEDPSIIIALDRSSSMALTLGTTGGTRLSVSQDAIKGILTDYGSLVQFGYGEFPGWPPSGPCGSGCCATGNISLPGPRGLDTIRNDLSQCSATVNCPMSGERPTAQMILHIDDSYNKLTNSNGPRYALLMTDGEPSQNCSSSNDPCSETSGLINDLTFHSMTNPNPVLTYVVGIGDKIVGAPNTTMTGNRCLESLARAGGVPRNAPPFYYPATTEASVRAYLTNIVSSTLCRIDINDQGFDPDRIELENGMIARDPTNQNGWNLDTSSRPKSIVLYGQACGTFVMTLKNSHQLHVTACPDPRQN